MKRALIASREDNPVIVKLTAQDNSQIEAAHYTRYFELGFGAGDGRQIVSDVRDLPYAYRGMEVVERVIELGLGELIARLDPFYVLKI